MPKSLRVEPEEPVQHLGSGPPDRDGQVVDPSDDGQEDAPHAVALYGGFIRVDAAYGGPVNTTGDGGSPDGDASSG